MRNAGARYFITMALAFLAGANALGQELSAVETDKLRLLYFDPTETYLVPRVIQTFHNSMDRQESILGYTPDEKITVLLTDFSDYGNAGATSVPSSSVVVDIAPIPLTFETSAATERMYTIMNHELVHISNTDQAAPADRKARNFFRGKVLAVPEHPETILYQYLTAPRKTSPRWFLEGMAVFLETWMAGGLGRAQGAYDEMVFRAMVRDDAHFYDPLGLVAEGVKVDFQVGANAYLYGTRFITWLAFEHSPEKVVEWAQRTEGSRRSYEEEFDRVFGKRLNAAWQDWITFEHEFQTENLGRIGEHPTTPFDKLTRGAVGSISRAYFDADTNSLIAGFREPGVVANIGELSLEDGDVRHLQDVKGPMVYRVASVAFDQASDTIFYTTDNYAYRDLMMLDRNTGKARMLQRDARIGEIVFNSQDKSLWGIRHLNGYAAIVRIPYPYTEWNLVKSLPYGGIAYDLDISPDGSKLSGSFGNLQGKHSLQVHEIATLLEDRLEPIADYTFGDTIPESFVFSPDGRYLFGSSYYTGVSNIFRFEYETGDLEAVSNTETGFFRPIPVDNENLIVFSYTGQGFIPARIKAVPLEDVSPILYLGTRTIAKHPVLETWRAGSPDDIDAEDRIVSRGSYSAAANLGMESMYPVLLGYKDSLSVGLKTNFSDDLRLDTLSIGAGYSVDSDLPSDERPNFSIVYRHNVISASPLSGAWTFSAKRNNADFYDLFGPTKRSRKGNQFSVDYEKTIVSDNPRRMGMSANLSHYTDIDSLPRFQNVPATFDQMSSLRAELEYSNVKGSLGAVDDEKGLTWHVGTGITHVDSDTIPKLAAGFDFGFALPWKHSSVWLRNSVGGAFGDTDDVFANFYFGGFGNNYVDRGSVKRYRNYQSMPGFEINAVPGRNFHRAMLEWNLPPVRFSRVGTPGFYLSWVRPAVFVSALTTNLDDSAFRQEVQSAGFQLDFRFTILSRMSMTLSAGYAKGFGNSIIPDDEEFMLSLKIL
jgi:Tol biopolymer transport system component